MFNVQWTRVRRKTCRADVVESAYTVYYTQFTTIGKNPFPARPSYIFCRNVISYRTVQGAVSLTRGDTWS